jgi:glycerol uptake facilitator-like aquaporin
VSVSLARRAGVEFVGTLALVAGVVGSGIQAQRLTSDVGVELLANSTATAFGLAVLITLLGPVSGAHLNPVVTLAAWWAGGRERGELGAVGAYLAAQVGGAVAGALLADAMFGGATPALAPQAHSGWHLWLGEVVATCGLVLLVVGLGRIGREALVAPLVAGYIGAAIWWTSSGAFANPAATVGRAFTDSFTGIAPGSVGPFVAAQSVGAVLGLALVPLLFGGDAARRSRVGIDADPCCPAPRQAPDNQAV